MTKLIFLNTLQSKLAGLPEEDIANRISFYSEMIDDMVDDGKSEEEAINEIGSVDDIVDEIAQDTPLLKLVKEKVKPKRQLRAWEIVLIVLGFPLWFPLVLVALILLLVAYILIWIMVIVTYTVETSLVVASIGSFVAFIAYMVHGDFNLMTLAASIMCSGGATLLLFGCIGATKGTIKLSKTIFRKIKSSIIRKGKNNNE